ncbi:hypothetical protein LJC55_02575 [Eubacteriales bacterium OttesenSCG-928-N14]|nr:hypothetical protein [Eubacteriales bacterium OttesenSCG-928-N14]
MCWKPANIWIAFCIFYPNIALINNIDDDHLDYFSGMDQIVKSFENFIGNVAQDGMLFGCIADERVIKLLRFCGKPYATYGITRDADYSARSIQYDENGCATFTAMYRGKKLFTTKLTLPGEYNVSNAMGATAVAHHIGIAPDIIARALAEYESAERRFKLYGQKDGVDVYHDYAHHPTAITAAMGAAQMHRYNKLWVVFEGDSYERLESFFPRIIEALDGADHVVVTKIFPGRGGTHGKYDGPDIAAALNERGIDSCYIEEYDAIAPYLHANWQSGDMVLVIGSGIINQHVHKILE